MLHDYKLKELKSADYIKVLDSGAGDGLSGVALREAGFDTGSTFISANDISRGMLDIAKERKCYDEIKVVDLNKFPLPYGEDEFDALTLTGAMTYVDPKSRMLEEFVRITKPGGLICYTNRTDKLGGWVKTEQTLEADGSWLKLEEVGPISYLPLNYEYGKSIEVVIRLYQVCDKVAHI